jgi:hypothetical protein
VVDHAVLASDQSHTRLLSDPDAVVKVPEIDAISNRQTGLDLGPVVKH